MLTTEPGQDQWIQLKLLKENSTQKSTEHRNSPTLIYGDATELNINSVIKHRRLNLRFFQNDQLSKI